MGGMMAPDREIDTATRERLGGEIVPVDVFTPWDPTDTTGIDPDIRESTPDELAGRVTS
jgi:hypothetical protein